MSDSAMRPSDKFIPLYFVLFFLVVGSVDAFFVYSAIHTHPGIVTDNAYEKGLAYNKTLETAKAQPKLQQKATFENGVLRWVIADEHGQPINNATVTAHIIRPAQAGVDFDVTLEHNGNNTYEATLPLPLKGLWIAKINGTWDSQQYQTTLKFIAP